jgi:hypothetical protein
MSLTKTWFFAMETKLTADDARQSLNAHVAEKGAEIHRKYGPAIGWAELPRLLEDRACVRYPCEVAFDSSPLETGECAHPELKGDRPEDGFRLCIHPFFKTRLEDVPCLVLYQLVLVNYGVFASADDAETFGASALGLAKDNYYERLCALADALAGGSNSDCACGQTV